MKKIHRASAAPLQKHAQIAARRMAEIRAFLLAEVTKNTVEIPKEKRNFLGGPKSRMPDTVTFQTEEIMRYVGELYTSEKFLAWFSTPVEMRRGEKPISY